MSPLPRNETHILVSDTFSTIRTVEHQLGSAPLVLGRENQLGSAALVLGRKNQIGSNQFQKNKYSSPKRALPTVRHLLVCTQAMGNPQAAATMSGNQLGSQTQPRWFRDKLGGHGNELGCDRHQQRQSWTTQGARGGSLLSAPRPAPSSGTRDSRPSASFSPSFCAPCLSRNDARRCAALPWKKTLPDPGSAHEEARPIMWDKSASVLQSRPTHR